MKTVFKSGLAGILLALFACKPAPAGQTAPVDPPRNFTEVQAEVRDVIIQQEKAWNSGSIDGFMEGYWRSDSLQFITKRGIRKGYDSVNMNYKKAYSDKEKMGTLAFSKLAFAPLDSQMDLVHVTGDWEVRQKSDTLSGLFSLVFKKIDSRWKIVIDHTW